MNVRELIPYAEPIPINYQVLALLEQLFFLIHILIINSILGLSLILLFKWGRKQDFFETNKPIAKKIPILFALGINMAIPALLFLQVTFGHLFYTSSILLGTFWILIIPSLIFAYYSSYYHYKKFETSRAAKYALFLLVFLVIYIAFILVNNLTMMESPESWKAYFSRRDGTILLWSLPSIYPRFLHFVVASVAVGGLFYALYFSKKSQSDRVTQGLKIFAYATVIQAVVGFWFLLSLPKPVMVKFLGVDSVATFFFALGIVTATLSVISALKGSLRLTLTFFLTTLVSMVINRYNLRIFSLNDYFSPTELKVVPQFDVFAVFVVILLIGVGVISYMLKVAFQREVRG